MNNEDVVFKEFFDWYFDPATGEIDAKSSKVLSRPATKDEIRTNRRYKQNRNLATIGLLICIATLIVSIIYTNIARQNLLGNYEWFFGNNTIATFTGFEFFRICICFGIGAFCLCAVFIILAVEYEKRRRDFLDTRSNYGFESEDKLNLTRYLAAHEKQIKWREAHPEAVAINDFKKLYIEESKKNRRANAMNAELIAMSILSRRTR